MTRTSDNYYIDGRLWEGFDYDNQAWVKDGRFVRCNHPDNMHCNCYGRIHEGERSEYKQEIIDDKNLEAIDRGMAESMNGQVVNRGSFAKYNKQEEIREGLQKSFEAMWLAGNLIKRVCPDELPVESIKDAVEREMQRLKSQDVVIKKDGELPEYLYHTILGLSDVERSTVESKMKSIMLYGLIPQIADEWADLMPKYLRDKPVVWLSKGIWQWFQSGKVLKIIAGLLDKTKLYKIESNDVDWWVYEGRIPPHLIYRVKSKNEMLKPGYTQYEELI